MMRIYWMRQNRQLGRVTMSEIKLLSVVAMLEDLPGQGLVRWQVGTVVDNWAPDIYEVEFCDDNGKTYAMAALKSEQLILLHRHRFDTILTGA